ncbi:TetR/AcrR family transcriptional regulator [Actinacidiphila paucisporea]|uniref:Transcriptional regulator, TetR family n=1 Tax=Actinacidiphila paucisporea TaxID=310782 RepID=A0A1M6WZV3_9ACTN|nr:TetR/AcrR family transcriptional regulator [Actinacidiphila paucisporea]SHK99267.1 transcriptional regulator, TetR family [Actinacidiphila paucisporea]
MDATTPARSGVRCGNNPRGKGERLRADIITTAARMLDVLADDQALSLRAVAREVGIAATSVYLHFADRDALVLATLERFAADIGRAMEAAEAAAADPAEALRARTLLLGTRAQEHAGLYKVLYESTLNQRVELRFKRGFLESCVTAVQRCVDAGLAPRRDARATALDLMAAVHGSVSLRINRCDTPWPPFPEQLDRFLIGLVGLPARG